MAPRHAAVTLGAMPDDARSTAARDDPVIRDADGGIVRLVAIMARLRDRERGCPWDIEQDFDSIAPYTIEEGYEVADAIARKDMGALRDELGDLLFQVVYHARMAEEAGAFAFDDVVRGISDKMVRRHPHVFGDDSREKSADQQTLDWERLKAAERGAAGALDGVAVGLPVLTRAVKLQNRAARVGFDWPDAQGPRLKIDEELGEIERAGSDEERAGEIGDLLFAVVNYARHLGVNPETALREATARFETRFRKVEELADKPLNDMNIDELETLWQRAKRLTR
ncbi:MAG TPA: nucleoside triphosphate pyrophosphohydrolase [Allosphingosinicella sp.]|nr:nucleoside triphosphate pyrophosphohydrolase [Allosphingosinicella sp.]